MKPMMTRARSFVMPPLTSNAVGCQSTSFVAWERTGAAIPNGNAAPAFDRGAIYFSGLRPASIEARFGSRNGGKARLSPSVSNGSSAVNPGPSVAISNRMPFGSRK